MSFKLFLSAITGLYLTCAPLIAHASEADDFAQAVIRGLGPLNKTYINFLNNPLSPQTESMATQRQLSYEMIDELRYASYRLQPFLNSQNTNISTTAKDFISSYAQLELSYKLTARIFDSFINDPSSLRKDNYWNILLTNQKNIIAIWQGVTLESELIPMALAMDYKSGENLGPFQDSPEEIESLKTLLISEFGSQITIDNNGRSYPSEQGKVIFSLGAAEVIWYSLTTDTLPH
jgi:hypothetical protein